MGSLFTVVEPQKVSYCCQQYKRASVVPDIVIRFYSNLEFLDGLSQRSPISNFTEIRHHVGAEVIHVARRKDGRERNRRFSRLMRTRKQLIINILFPGFVINEMC